MKRPPVSGSRNAGAFSNSRMKTETCQYRHVSACVIEYPCKRGYFFVVGKNKALSYFFHWIVCQFFRSQSDYQSQFGDIADFFHSLCSQSIFSAFTRYIHDPVQRSACCIADRDPGQTISDQKLMADSGICFFLVILLI